MKFYICGNPLLPEDNLPIRLIPELRERFHDHEFLWLDPTENLKPEDGKLCIIDTVLGIERVTLIDDVEKIQIDRVVSLHDFDLAFNLKLLFKIGNLKKILIFGLPKDMACAAALEQLTSLLKDTIPNLS